MVLLIPLIEKLHNEPEELLKNDTRLTYIQFLEATIVILKDYNFISAVGMNIIKLIELSINQNSSMIPHEREVSYKI